MQTPTIEEIKKALREKKNMSGADLSRGHFVRALLQGADLSNANLEHASLYQAYLLETNLSGANLQYADLRKAQFRNADLRGANLRYAALSGADFQGACLRGVEGLPKIAKVENIHQAVFNQAARPGALDMEHWHTCETMHCRAGWVILLAGETGRQLEEEYSTRTAAAMIYMASDPNLEQVPDWYVSNEEALADMERMAKFSGKERWRHKMYKNNIGVLPENVHDALQDDNDWRESGKPPKKIWNIYKRACNPDSYRNMTGPYNVEILRKHGFDDPCPISEEEWAKQNPKEARKVAKRKARLEEQWLKE